MIENLLREKRRYGLPEEITEYEMELLEQGYPVQKIIGYIIFDDLKIHVDHNVLIPRYETEEVVRESLKYITKDSKVLDIGTGSGYIGLTIKHKSGADVTMTDISDDAIKQAKENASKNKLDVKIFKSDIFENVTGRFDVIVSNPPYIPEDILLSESVTEHEPELALYGGRDGNDIFRKILEDVENYLNPGGVVVFEMSIDNSEYLEENGFVVLQDINEKDRIAVKIY